MPNKKPEIPSELVGEIVANLLELAYGKHTGFVLITVEFGESTHCGYTSNLHPDEALMGLKDIVKQYKQLARMH